MTRHRMPGDVFAPAGKFLGQHSGPAGTHGTIFALEEWVPVAPGT
jgi:hypothetical protein